MNSRARQWLAEAHRAGRARRVPGQLIDQAQQELPHHLVTSDDAHVLALARASGARLLYTHDQELIDDFTNPRLISAPRGKVYKSEDNRALLRAGACGR